MRKILALILIAPTLFLTSCSDGDCIDDMVGIFEGTETCGGTTTDIEITVAKSTIVEDQLVMTVSGSTLIWTANPSTTCLAMTVPDQEVTLNGASTNTVGLFNLNGNALTGSLDYTGTGVCLYVLSRP